ncbi:BamA/TamA family outer membrane protein [candidate division KSB1 bacterium]|nr:BamA/TamA family outer membrane protein [candidate division KSB1 bacterium]
MVKIFFCFFIVLLVFTTVWASDDQAAAPDSLIITDIVIVGNKKTKDFVITREMKTKIGDRFEAEKIERDRKRIQNLRLFTRIEVQHLASETGIVLIIFVAERWFVFPYPILYYNEKDWKKLSYGAGLLYQNFRGRNISLGSYFWLGYNPGYGVFLSNPWIGGSWKLYYNVELYDYKIKSQSLQLDRFDEAHRGFQFLLGKRFGYHTYLSTQLGYIRLSVPERLRHVTLSGNATDHLPSIALAFRYDNRDLVEYPKKGWFFDTYIKKTKYGNQIDYTRYGIDVRKYTMVYRQISLGLRASTDLSEGEIPIYGRTFLGYLERVRGHFNDHREGENRLMGSAELRIPLLPVRYINLQSNSMLFGEYSNNLPFGISCGIFYDTGAVWFQDGTLQKGDFLSGAGVGLHFHVPYIDILRLEYAFDEEKNAEFIVDIYVWF